MLIFITTGRSTRLSAGWTTHEGACVQPGWFHAVCFKPGPTLAPSSGSGFAYSLVDLYLFSSCFFLLLQLATNMHRVD